MATKQHDDKYKKQAPSRGVLRRGLQGLDAYLRRELFRDQWFIAWRLREHPDDPNNEYFRFRHLRPPRDSYWADPFPVRVGTSYYLFFEEFRRPTKKGRIVVSEMLAGGQSHDRVVAMRGFPLPLGT